MEKEKKNDYRCVINMIMADIILGVIIADI